MVRNGYAIVMRQYGGPGVLRIEKVPLTALQPDEIRIRAIASAVNHSDLEICWKPVQMYQRFWSENASLP
jgi:NADPH2:quinone reductase